MMRRTGGRGLVTVSRQLLPAAVPVSKAQPKYRVAIVGGGSAGVSVASQLLRKLPKAEHGQVAVIEPRDTHLYQPYWTMVGGLGLKSEDSARPMEMVMPLGVQWIKDRCTSFDPTNNSLTLAGGERVDYDVLVVAAGLQQNFTAVPGLAETLGENGVASIYSYKYAPKVWENITAMSAGKAIFTNPATAVNCGGAPQKIAYLAESAWRSRGVRGAIDIEFCTATPGIFACTFYREALEELMREKGIVPHVKTNLVEVDGPAKRATFERQGGELVTKKFDILHVTPPMSAPDFVKNSPLANAAGFIDVDKETCQHVRYPNVFSLGDCSSLPTSKTYAAISSEAPVVVHNVMAMLRGHPEDASAAYEGYTACPLLVGDSKLMLAEFNGYSMDPAPTFWPLDQRRPSYLFYLMKRFVFAQPYWHLMPLGLWFGKHTIFEPKSLPRKKLPQAAAAAAVAVPPSSHAALQAGVNMPRGEGAVHATDSVAAGESELQSLRPERLGVATPELPGDVSLAGDMTANVVAQLAPRYRGWLYLNDAGHPGFHSGTLEAAGCRVEVVPVPSPSSGSTPTAAHAEAVLGAMARLPRPLMVQCTAGNRAGAALLLFQAKLQGRNRESAKVLAQDLDLKFFTQCSECGPVRDWVLDQLPSEPGSADTTVAAEAGPETDKGFVIQQLFDNQGSSTFTYLVGCTASHEAVLIDPVLGMEGRDLALLGELGFELKYVVNTHCHADHVTSGAAIKKLRPGVRTVISEASRAAADIKLRDGDQVAVGRYALDALATPGHTDGCMTFVLKGPGEPLAAFTGDTLLIRGCGRTDFQQGDASKLYDMVHTRLFSLPDATRVYPGHDYKGRNLSTVGEERQFNPRLTKSRDEFVKLMRELNLPYPKLMDVAVPANMADGVQA